MTIGGIGGELAGLAAALSWAIGSLLFERVMRGQRVAAAAVNVGKSLTGAVVLFAASVIVSSAPLSQASRRDVALLALSGIVGIALGDTAFFGALAALGAPAAVLLLSSAPLFVVAIDAVRGTLPTATEGIGIVVTLAGIALVVLRPGAGRVSVIGLAYGFAAGLCQAGGSLLSRAATQGSVSPLTASYFRLAVGSAALLAFGLASGRLGAWYRDLRGTLHRIVGASFVGTVLGLFLSQVALAKSSSAGVASTLLATSPIFALPLAHVSGSERVTVRAVAGAILAVAGVALLVLG